MYRALARWCYQHRWTVVGLWVVGLIAINAVAGAVGEAYSSEFTAPQSESTRGFEVLETHFPDMGGGLGGSIVFATPDGVHDAEVAAAMEAMFAEAATIEGVTIVSPYSPFGAQQIAPDGEVAYAQVNLEEGFDEAEAIDVGDQLAALTPDLDGLTVEVGGWIFAEVAPPETELIGLAFAVVVLILAFGSVMAMGLPIAVAVAGVAVGGVGVVTLLTHTTTIPEIAPLIGIMIGLGVGIDYALFIVTRYRELTRAGADPQRAIEGAMDTAGRAVVFAGITVMTSLLGLLLIGLEFIGGMGIAASVTVAATLLASITLLPSLLAIAHARLEITRWRGLIAAGFAAIGLLGLGLGIGLLGAIGGIGAVVTLLAGLALTPLRREVPTRRARPLRDTLAYRWSRAIQARPWTFLVVGAGLLGVLTVPVFGLQFGFSDEGNLSEELSARRAYDLIAEGFGPGHNGPFVVAIEADGAQDLPAVQAIADTVAADEGVAQVSPPFPSDPADPTAAEAFLIQVVPTTSPQDAETEATVLRIRDDIASVAEGTGVEAWVTGAVPTNIDFGDYLEGRMLLFFGAVLGVSFLLLMMVFRSLLVPLKAVVMNLLSIAAAYGVVVALFQWGWLGGLTGIAPGPIEPFVPMMLFAIVFGLSMDYEVFLLSRIKEEYDRTGDPARSVADGLAATARVISAAAAIMVVVFGSFLLEDDRIVKLFGTGLGVAVLLDATLVRMLLVPATMELLGSRNWWLPRWLDRILPTLNVEGAALEELPAGSELDLTDDDWVRVGA